MATKVLDPYKVLGVAPGAGMPAIKAAYRVRVKQHHPDMVATSDGTASSAFLSILDAFTVLSDPVLRAQYDQQLAQQRQAAEAAAPLKLEPPRSRSMAMARAGIAIVELGFWGGVSLLFLLVLVVGLIEISTGK